MNRSLCLTDPRSTATADLIRRLLDYAAGYADARAEQPDDD